MRVILLDNIRGIGQVGDVKDVSDGYARNFLFPRRAAKPATDGILKDATAIRGLKLQAASLAHQQASELAAKLNDAILELTGKANDKGRLFAGIEAQDIARSLTEFAGIAIPAGAVKLPEHIKTIGEHRVAVQLAPDITATVTVRVTGR